MTSIPANACRYFTVLRKNDRLFQDFACFRIDRLLNSDHTSGSTSVTFGPLDRLIGGLESICRPWTSLRPCFSNCWTM